MMPPRDRESMNDDMTFTMEEAFCFPKMLLTTTSIVFDPAFSQSQSVTVEQAKLECLPPLRRCKMFNISERNERSKGKSKSSRLRTNNHVAETEIQQQRGKLVAMPRDPSQKNPKRRNSSDEISPARPKEVRRQVRRSNTCSPVRPSRWDAESSLSQNIHQDCIIKPPSRNPRREVSACKSVCIPSPSLYEQLYDHKVWKRDIGNINTAALLGKALDDLKLLEISEESDSFQNSFANYKDSDLLLLDSSNSSIGSY